MLKYSGTFRIQLIYPSVRCLDSTLRQFSVEMNIWKKSVAFTSDRDIPSLEGKVILVTGGNAGLGKQCILEYARHNPAQLWLVARTLDKAKTAADEVQKQLSSPANIKLLEMELSSFDSISEYSHTFEHVCIATRVNLHPLEKAAATFTAEADRLDILMLNAGIMAHPPGLTNEGYELQFGSNFLGHALLTKLLLPVLEETARKPNADVRIIALSSHGHIYAPNPDGILFSTLQTPANELGAYTRYGQSKIAAILWARQMAKEYPDLTFASIDPGIVNTGLMESATATPAAIRIVTKLMGRFLKTPEQGVRNQLWASVGADVKSGLYYESVGIAGVETDIAKDDLLAKKLLEWTEEQLCSQTIS